MITKLNLATKPFRNRVLPYLLAGLMLVVSLIGGLFCVAGVRQNNRENELLATGIQERQAEISRLKGEGEKVQQLLTPEQKAILTASHRLVANKSFGWSKLFSDLEGVLPGSVSASRVAVNNVFQDGPGQIKAELELGVISRDYASVMAMLDNMNNSGLFRAELRGQDLQKNERVTYTEYTFRVIYSPTYSAVAVPTGDVAYNQTGGGQ